MRIHRPFDVAAWVKDLQQAHGAPGVKQQLAAVRMLFDCLITGQIVLMNPAAARRCAGRNKSSRPARRRCHALAETLRTYIATRDTGAISSAPACVRVDRPFTLRHRRK
jgi:hypothetical protein